LTKLQAVKMWELFETRCSYCCCYCCWYCCRYNNKRSK